MQRLLQWILISIIVFFGFLVIVAVSLPFFLPNIENYHDKIENKIAQALNEKVHIQRVSLTWHGVQPLLTLKNIQIDDQQNNHLMVIDQMSVGLNIFKSLLFWKLEPEDLSVAGTVLYLKQDQNGILHINNIRSLDADLHSEKNEKLQELLRWFLSSGNKSLNRITLHWINKNNDVPIYIDELRGNSGFLLHQYHGNFRLADSGNSDFQARIVGLASLIHWLKGDINILLNQLTITKVLPSIPIKNDYQATSGRINLSSKLSWGPTKLIRINNVIAGQDINLLIKNTKKLTLDTIEGHFVWQLLRQGWALSFDQLQIRTNNEFLPFHSGKIEISDGLLKKQLLALDTLPLQKINELLTNYNLLPKEFTEQWLHFNPQGSINHFTLTHYGSNFQDTQFDLLGSLENVSISQWKTFPGITNLSGDVKITPKNGFLKINSTNFGFYYPKLFRQNLSAQKIRTTINWKKSSDQWLLWFKDIYVSTRNGNASGKIKLIIPTKMTSPFIQSKIQFHVNNLETINPYLPIGIMHKPLIGWLDHAFKNGSLSNGEMNLEGYLKDFPFINKNGIFRIQAQMHDLSLHYLSDWPTITGINGGLQFDKASLTAQVNKAAMIGSNLNHVKASIPDLRHSKLFLKGAASTVPDSSISINQQNFAKVSKALGDLDLRGIFQLGLSLVIPIDTGVASDVLQMKGKLHFNDTDLASSKWNLNLKNIKGDVGFTEKNVVSNQISAKFLNQAISLNLKTAKDLKSVQMHFLGNILADDLRTKFNLPIFKNISGMTTYTGLMELSRVEDTIVTSMSIHSDLKGIGVALPTPFEKKENTVLPSTFNFKITPHKQSTMQFFYGSQLSGIFNFNSINNQFTFDRGSLNLGNRMASLPLQKGLEMRGEIPELNLTTWRDFINQNNLVGHKKDFHLNSIFSKINLKIDKLAVENFNVESAQITAALDQKNWMIGIDSPKIQGQITVPNEFPQLPVQGKFEHITLDDFKSNQLLKPGSIPPLNLEIDHLKIKERNINHLKLNIIPQGSNLQIKQLSINEPLFSLNASGWWRDSSNHQSTLLMGQIKSSNIGAVLNQWQITDNMVQGIGNIQFHLAWQNSPMSPRVSTMNGQVGLQFKSGRIIHLTQQATMGLGIGRVLNLLSLQTLPRRLHLDFSDITSPGFPYDEMNGNFTLKDGNAFTDDAYLDGPLAKVRVQGKIGLENKDYNLRLIISPNVTSSLPLVATITAGPIVGAITWAADKILSRQVKKITEIHYNVTGSWSKPNLVQLSK